MSLLRELHHPRHSLLKAVTDHRSTSYSSLIMANPSQLASPPDQPDDGAADADAYITPSDIDLPSAATLSLSGTLPALPSSSTPNPLGSSETGGVRVVGQDVSKSDIGAGTDAGSETTENTNDSNDEADQPNSAGSSVRTGAGAWAGASAVTGLMVFVGLL